MTSYALSSGAQGFLSQPFPPKISEDRSGSQTLHSPSTSTVAFHVSDIPRQRTSNLAISATHLQPNLLAPPLCKPSLLPFFLSYKSKNSKGKKKKSHRQDLAILEPCPPPYGKKLGGSCTLTSAHNPKRYENPTEGILSHSRIGGITSRDERGRALILMFGERLGECWI